ncbi:MAG: O-antigen ligase family protein [Desulfobulbus sp.]
MIASHRAIGKYSQYLLFLMAFFIPMSTSLSSVFAVFIVFLWIFGGDYKEKIREIINNPICVAIILFLIFMLLGLFWSEDLHLGLLAIKHRWKIFTLPFFVYFVINRYKWKYIYSFVCGVIVTLLIFLFKYFNFFQNIQVDTNFFQNFFDKHYLVFTPLLAFAFYIVVHQLVFYNNTNKYRVFLSFISVLFVFSMFLMKGRAGQVAFFVLVFLLIFQFYSNNFKKTLKVSLLLFPIVFSCAYFFSPIFHGRINQIYKDINSPVVYADNSTGLRLNFWKVSFELIKENPLLGVGTGDFVGEYKKINQIMSPGVSITDNPHNQYIFIAAQLGVLGLCCFLSIFWVYFYQCYYREDDFSRIQIAFPLFFMTIMMFESYLDITETGLFFSLMSAILFKKQIDV